MSQTLRVSFESPQSGWMALSLEAGGRKFVTAAAHAPYDSLRELLEALASLIEGRVGRAVVRWNREPEEFDFVFEAEGRNVALDVVRYPDHRRLSRSTVFSARGASADVCREFWRELRQLRRRATTDVFESNWRRAFPEAELRNFTKSLREHERKLAATPPSIP